VLDRLGATPGCVRLACRTLCQRKIAKLLGSSRRPIAVVRGRGRSITVTSRRPATSRDWQAQAKGIIRGELKRRNLGYKDLAERLQGIGVKDTERNISNKIARGGFTAVFFLQCMEAIGVQNIHLNGEA
jgi:hypothetical protein